MFEGVQTCAPQKNPLILIWDERTIKRAQTVSEDPYRRERKFVSVLYRETLAVQKIPVNEDRIRMKTDPN